MANSLQVLLLESSTGKKQSLSYKDKYQYNSSSKT